MTRDEEEKFINLFTALHEEMVNRIQSAFPEGGEMWHKCAMFVIAHATGSDALEACPTDGEARLNLIMGQSQEFMRIAFGAARLQVMLDMNAYKKGEPEMTRGRRTVFARMPRTPKIH